MVRPIVKVIVSPSPNKTSEPDSEPEIETILEDAKIEIDAPEEEAPEVMATVSDEIDDEDITDILAAIPTVEESEDVGIDAVDVFWKERPNKFYTYDPDGNTVEKGDIVLVPTRDIESDKEIVREAEVARGNYKIDPETLDRPLKKIIGVVKRKAEEIFTAMITPDEETLEKNEEQN